nr:MAG TPA: hypothetical protein [Caudoviricetes sp.]
MLLRWLAWPYMYAACGSPPYFNPRYPCRRS